MQHWRSGKRNPLPEYLQNLIGHFDTRIAAETQLLAELRNALAAGLARRRITRTNLKRSRATPIGKSNAI
jgi:hypothetical protein